MTKRLDVVNAVVALIVLALPSAEVLALDNDAAAPGRIGDGGRVIVRSGDPGDPELDLSPLTYNYDHQIPVEFMAYGAGSLTAEQAVDTMLAAASAAIKAHRTLGGVVDWLDGFAPVTGDIFENGAKPARGATVQLLASYSTPDPL